MLKSYSMSQKQGTRFFKHYKNKPYKFIGIVRHSETLEEMALYESLYENKLGSLWVRPKDMFFENVEINGISRPRFEKIDFIYKSSEVLSESEFQQIKLIYGRCFLKEPNEEKFKSKLDAHKNFLFLTAYDGDKLVAFKFGYAQDQALFYSWIGAVLPEYRKLGIASELIEQQHQWCRDKKFKKIETRTRNQFASMISLNYKFGFKIIGTQMSQNDDIKIILEKVL